MLTRCFNKCARLCSHNKGINAAQNPRHIFSRQKYPAANTGYDLLFEKNMRYTPFIEAMRFVGELNEAGIECAIVTSSSLQKMENLYKQNPGFRDKFKAVITSDLVTFSKPHPQPYLLGAKAIGVSPENCFVFEDSLSGIESGKAAGATVIGLATTLPLYAIKGKAHKTISDFAGFHISDMLSVKQN